MTQLSQNDLDWFAARLSIAVYETNKLGPMSIQDIIEFLKPEVPGADGLSMTYAANQNQVFHIGDKSVEVSPMASNEEIKAAFLSPWIPTANTKVEIMSITGIQSGAFQSKLAEMRQKMGDKQASALAKIDNTVTAGMAQLDAAADNAATKAQKEIDDALQEFATFTNGGPE